MDTIKVIAGDFTFTARFENELAPQTCATFKKELPFLSSIIHVRWSGEGMWMPLGDKQFGVGFENNTSYPNPGQIVLYPGGVSETEILISYGYVNFASKAGQLSGNHFLTITDGLDDLYALGRQTLLKGEHPIRFETT